MNRYMANLKSFLAEQSPNFGSSDHDCRLRNMQMLMRHG